jgi:succinoglycan biosynthesis transport protein ExoP
MALPQSYVSVSRRPPDVEDYIDMLRRHRPWIIGPMFAGLVISTVVAFLWPDTFVSKATLRVTPQRVSERLVPADYTQLAQRLTAMEQEILSRTTLEGIITDPSLDLYKRQRGQKPMEDIVSDMRQHDIEIKFAQTPGSNANDSRSAATAFSISFSYPDKFKAQQVVRMLVSKFTEQNVTVLRDQAHLTTTFLDDELKQAQERLNILEDKITQFKLQNHGKLPEELTSNTTMLNSMLLQQSQLNQSLQSAMDRKASLETALDGLRNQLQFLQNNTEDTVSSQQQVAAVENQQLLTATAALQSLESQLAGLRQIYGESNPEIRNLKARIASAQATKDSLEKEQQKKSTAPPPADNGRKIPNKNVQMQVVNVQAQIEQLKTSIVEASSSIKLIQGEQQELTKRINSYEGRIEAAPLNERQWAALQREHLLAQQDFDEKMKKRQSAETVQSMEEHKAGEQLEVLDPASDPQQPTEPKRAEWAATGTAIGLFLGIVMAGAKEMKNTSLKNLKDVRAYTNLPVLSSIPLLENALLVRRKRRLFWVAWSSAFVFGSIAVLASVYYYYSGQR